MQLSPFENNLFSLLFSAAVMHSFYLAIILILKSRKEKGLQWLGIMMIPVSMLLLVYLLYINKTMISQPQLLGVFQPFLFLIGPFYWLFVRTSITEKSTYYWYDLFHLVPFFIVLWNTIPLYELDIEEKLAIIHNVYYPSEFSWFNFLKGNTRSFGLIAYLIFIYFNLKTRLQNDTNFFLRIKWFLNFSRVFLAILISKFIVMSLFLFFNWDGSIMELVLVLIMVFAIHFLGYVVLGKTKVLPEILIPPKSEKYSSSPLTQTEIIQLKEIILNYFNEKRPWLKPDFNISQLSNSLRIPSHHISHTLNEGMQMSFLDLVNQFRVEEVKKRLSNGDILKYSFLGIANESGFGSKSSFNRAFKKLNGMTPSEWLKTINQEA